MYLNLSIKSSDVFGSVFDFGDVFGSVFYFRDVNGLQIGGPVQDLSNFQMAPIPFLRDLTHSTHSPHDILKV